MSLKPTDALAEVSMLLELTVKRVYRDQPMTDQELDEWTDRILRWAEEQKKGVQHEEMFKRR